MTEEPLVLGGRYEVGRVLGRGGMAEVRLAHDTRLDRDVAVKQLRADLAGDPIFQARFKREAQSAAGLNHPTIVSVYDTGVRHDDAADVDIPFIVMELVEGSTLRDILREGRRILPERAFEISAGVLDALAYSHKAGIIHRDIKPANVMLTKTGQVKVMDFGIARAVADTQATMTQTAAVIGTAQYLSPEQARGETVDARSDVYSAGCLLYELLTTRPPFVGDSPVSVAYQHVREVPPAPSTIDQGDGDGDGPAITPDMDAIVLKSLAKDPADRYQSAGQMKDDIERLLNHKPIAAVIPAAFLNPEPAPASAQDATMLLGSADPADQTAATNLLGRGVEPGAAEVAPVAAGAVATREKERDRDKTSPGMAVLITLLVLALLAGLGFLGYRWWQSQQVQLVEVPSVIGYTEDAAKSSLQNQHLKPVVKYVDDANAQTEAVTAQSPAGGNQVPQNSEVAITVTKIPNKLTIPQVRGMSEKSARTALVNAGFKDGNITTQESTVETANVPKGNVTDVTPAEGSKGSADTKIVLTLSNGKVNVPALYGLSRAAAEQALSAKGLRLGNVTEKASSTDTANTVISQDPGTGSAVDQGSSIDIVLATPPPAPTTPTQSPSPTPTTTATATPTPSPSPTGQKTP